MHTAIYPGSFDPITRGHVDIIERAARLSDTLLVVVMKNVHKQGMFSVEERMELIRTACAHIPNVQVSACEGLLIECVQAYGAQAVVRGLRSSTDFEYELQMALTNKKINPGLETYFLAASERYTYLSSSIVKELASYGADLSEFLPQEICQTVADKVRQEDKQHE